jgi:acyl-CoA synthetase (AMP-forming)/AMP-acid ligase II
VLDQGLTIGAVLRATACAAPDKIAIEQDDLTLTWAEFDDRVDRLACALQDAGVAKGARVAYLFWNQWEILLAYHAVTRIGAVVVSLNYRLTAVEVADQLRRSAAAALIYDESFAETVAAAVAALDRRPLCVAAGAKVGPAAATVAEMTARPAPRRPEIGLALSDADDSGIWFTSGTTGVPKGAVVRHASSVWSGTLMAHAIGVRHDSRLLTVAPLFHRGAMEDFHLGATLHGATHVFMTRFEARRMLDMMERRRITHAFVVPTMSWLVLNEPSAGEYDLSAMECWMSASAPFPAELQEGLRHRLRLGADVIANAYGITESLFNTYCAPAELRARPTSAGRVVPAMRVAIWDEAHGFLADGAVGEIVTGGPTTFRTYLDDEAAFRAATFAADGIDWYKSGDLGFRDAGGHFHIVDRKKDMIITGGENVYSVEVETAIARAPKVAEVAVIGLPDRKWGETVVAAVVARKGETLTADDVIAACADLSPYKRPRHVHLVDALPRNSFGKVQKPALKAMLAPR